MPFLFLNSGGCFKIARTAITSNIITILFAESDLFGCPKTNPFVKNYNEPIFEKFRGQKCLFWTVEQFAYSSRKNVLIPMLRRGIAKVPRRARCRENAIHSVRVPCCLFDWSGNFRLRVIMHSWLAAHFCVFGFDAALSWAAVLTIFILDYS